MSKTLIIGAGIAGLLAGTVLKAEGDEVIILDKGRGVGGRMATRRMGQSGLMADHGAQFFTVRDARFADWVGRWIDAGVVAEWCRGFGPSQDGFPRYRGMPGMTGIAKHLAAELEVKVGTRVLRIERQGEGWRATTEDGNRFDGQRLIMTPPVPQSLQLLAAGGVSLPSSDFEALSALRYEPTFAVLLRLNGETKIGPPGAIQVRGETIDWIFDNRQKGITEETTVTIHATNPFSRRHFDDDREAVAQRLIEAAAAAGYVDPGLIVETQTQRWRYAVPIACYPERTLYTEVDGSPILFAGDAFGHPRVEGAALSGLAAAEKLGKNDE